MEIRDKLFELQDIKYKEFHKRLCPTKKEIIGVKIPVLKKYAKDLYKVDSDALNKIGNKYYEEIVLQGFLIALMKEPVDKKIKLIRKFVSKIDNWAVCDVFCSSLRIKNNEKEIYFEYLKEYYNSKEEFELRFIIVMLLDHFLEDEYIDDVFKIIETIKSDKYYVNMAIAWLLSIAFIKYRDKTLLQLEKTKDDWIYNKSIQKIIESKRVSDKDKEYLRNKKRKNNR